MQRMDKRLKKLVLAAIVAALVFVITFLIRIPIPATNGAYVNAGDSIVYLSALTPGGFFAAGAASIGSALADLLSGAGIYALPTFFIKAAMALVCYYILRRHRRQTVYFLLGSICGGIVMLMGYFIAEWLMFGIEYALLTTPGNVVQLVGGVAIALPLYLAARRMPGQILGD